MARTSFGFESRIGQASYPILIGLMLLVHRHVFPAYPALKNAEFFLSIILIAGYVVCRKFLQVPAFGSFRPHIQLAEKLVEVYIGVTVISSLMYVIIISVFGRG